MVTGVRAWDMALRLRYDEVPIGTVEPDLTRAQTQRSERNSHNNSAMGNAFADALKNWKK